MVVNEHFCFIFFNRTNTVLFRTMFLDRDWFTLETASTLIANHSGLLHAPSPVQAPAAAAETTEPAQQQQQQGKQRQTKQQKQDQSPPQPPPVPLSAVEIAAAALSGTDVLLCHGWWCYVIVHSVIHSVCEQDNS